MSTNSHSIIYNIQRKMRTQSDYDNARFVYGVLAEFGNHFTDDNVMEHLAEIKDFFDAYLDTYDPTP